MTRLSILILIYALAVNGAGVFISAAQATEKQDHSTDTMTVKIGLLLPGPDALGARHGAELAILHANRNGGYSGTPFRLLVRTTDGPWGAGSKESVSLVFEDEVAAMMGSLDGRNAHLAEQVAAKAKVLFLSAWATEMTLSQAFVPWYFRCVPNDDQQATVLISEISERRKLSRVAVIGTEEYDSRNAVRSFVKKAASLEVSLTRPILYRSDSMELSRALEEIKQKEVEAVVLMGNPSLARVAVPMMRRLKMDQDIFGNLSLMDDQTASTLQWELLEGLNLVSSGHWLSEKGIAFQEEFTALYGYRPGPAAAYAYDGMNLLIDVIRKGGTDRDRIIEAFGDIHKSSITGVIRFDEYGNRMDLPGLITVENGEPHRINPDNYQD